MSIPKIKLYRLDENYNPNSSVDLQTAAADEIYPFVPKDVSLSVYEELVGVTYRDLQIGTAGNVRTVELEAVEDSTLEYQAVCCEGWCRGEGMISAVVRYTEGATESEFEAWSYGDEDHAADMGLRNALWFDYFHRDEFVAEDGEVYSLYDDIPESNNAKISFDCKRRREYVKLTIGNEWSRGKNILSVSLNYHIFNSNLEGQGAVDKLTLEYGNIYDGRPEGRAVTANNAILRDSSGRLAVKSEGNKGYRCRFYPLRQKVIVSKSEGEYNPTTFAGWNPDGELSENGIFSLSNCENWITNLTDERHPRLFECINIGNSQYLHELVQDEQYTVEYIHNTNGTLDIKYQLSQSYYRAGTNLVFPNEVIVRYNEEDDILSDVGEIDYFNPADSTGNSGRLSDFVNNSTNMYKVSKRFSRLALHTGRDAGKDFQLDYSDNYAVVDLNEFNEFGGIDLSSLRIYNNGELIYSGMQSLNGYIVTVNGTQMTVTIESPVSAGLPTCLMFMYELGMDAWWSTDSNSDAPWSYGFRVCCYEKTNSSSLFVSSFRNWINNHLNNNPDVFYGFQVYDGTTDSSRKIISHTDLPYSVLYRDGAVLFSNKIQTTTLQQVKNFPPSGSSLTSASSDATAAPYVKRVFAKFAYYDGISDITNGIMREISADQTGSKYALFDADNPIDTNNIERLSANIANDDEKKQFIRDWSVEDKKWILRDDANLPTVFYSRNQYLPSPVSVESSECDLFAPVRVEAGRWLSFDLSKLRDIALVIPTEEEGVTFWLGVENLSNGSYEIKDSIDTPIYTFRYEKSSGIPQEGAGLAAISVYENGNFTLIMEGITPVFTFNSEESIAANLNNRKKYIFNDSSNLLGYDICFEEAEGLLIISRIDR